jgi:hypothetical protein
MGFYIQGPNLGKADYLLTLPDFKEITREEADFFLCEDVNGLVVVVENGPFDAAVYVFNDAEFEDFVLEDDPRPKRFLSGPREVLEELSGYTKHMEEMAETDFTS